MARRNIRLTFESGESVTAEMLDDEAPETCALVWDLLPLSGRALHGQYSGAEVFLKLDAAQPAPDENLVQLPPPGEILYFYDPGVNVTSGRQPTSEICFVYGRGVVLRGPEGVPGYARLFARVPGDWKYDWPDFARACRGVRHDRPQTLRIERA